MLGRDALKKTLVVEAKHFSVIVGYLWIVFSLFELHKWVILRQHNIGYALAYKVGFSFINAIVLGKVIFIVEELHVVEHLAYKPILYPILYKSVVFSVILICFHSVEELFVGIVHGKTMTQSIPAIGGGGAAGILLVGAISFLMLIPFFAFREVGRIMGEDALTSLLLGRGTKAGTVKSRVQQGNDRVA
jgi:hypothetical protein